MSTLSRQWHFKTQLNNSTATSTFQRFVAKFRFFTDLAHNLLSNERHVWTGCQFVEKRALHASYPPSVSSNGCGRKRQ